MEYKTKQQQVQITLHQLKKRINQYYFSILLLQEKQKLLEAKKEQLQVRLKEVLSGIEYGTILPSADKVLEAELIKIQQQFTEIDHTQQSQLHSLSQLIGKNLSSQIKLEPISIKLQLSDTLQRPELELFNYKKELINASKTLLAKENSPKLMGFATGGYGNPGLNMLDNSFQSFYIVGLQLKWHILDWNKNKKQRAALQITNNLTDTSISAFRLNTQIELDQQLSEIQKLTTLIESDEHIVNLHNEVLHTANSQLRNGVITSSEYITELTNLNEAQNTMETHKIQLELAKATYNLIIGN